MIDDPKHQERLQRNAHLAGFTGILDSKDTEAEETEGSVRRHSAICEGYRCSGGFGVSISEREFNMVPVFMARQLAA